MTVAAIYPRGTRHFAGLRPDIGPVVVSSAVDADALCRVGVDAISATGPTDPVMADVDAYALWPELGSRWLAGWADDSREQRIIDSYSPADWLNQGPRTDDDVAALVLDGWPALDPLDDTPLPRITSEMLPGWAGEFASAMADAIEVPLELAAVNVLGAVSVATARRYEVQVNAAHSEPTNLWLIGALPPGNRKSSALNQAFRPLADWERDRAAELAPEIAQVQTEIDIAEARAKKLKGQAAGSDDPAERRDIAAQIADLERAKPEPLRPPRLWTSDSTPEKLSSLMEDSEDECVGWVSSEGGLFDIAAGRYTGGALSLDTILQGWSCDPIRVDRAGGRSVRLDRPTITMCLSPQPDVLRGLANQRGFAGRGLLARYLYFLPPSPVGYRRLDNRDIPRDVAGRYRDGMARLLERPRCADGRETLTLTEGARAELRDFALHIERSSRPGAWLGHMTDWAGKAAGVAARVAGVFHCIKQPDPAATPIGADTMGLALEFVAVAAEHSVAAYRLMSADAETERLNYLLAWITRHRRPSFTLRDCHQSTRKTLGDAVSVLSAARELEQRGYVRVIEQVSTGGRRPSEVVQVRPTLSAGWS